MAMIKQKRGRRLKIRQQIAIALILITCYLVASLTSFLYPNPFRVATETAQSVGNWTSTQVQFVRGQYRYALFGSVVEAELRVQMPDENVLAHIEIAHSLWRGWTVKNFQTQSGASHF